MDDIKGGGGGAELLTKDVEFDLSRDGFADAIVCRAHVTADFGASDGIEAQAGSLLHVGSIR